MEELAEGETALRWRRAVFAASATVLLTIGCVVGGRLLDRGPDRSLAVESSGTSTSVPVSPAELTPKQCVSAVLDRFGSVLPKRDGVSAYEVNVPPVPDGCKRVVVCADGGGSLRVLVGSRDGACDAGRQVVRDPEPDPVAERDETSTTSTTAAGETGGDSSSAGGDSSGIDSAPSSQAPRQRSSSVTGAGTVSGSPGKG